MRDTTFKIYSRNYANPSTLMSPTSKVSNSLMAEGCIIRGTVEHSVLYTGCVVEEGAVVRGSVVMPNTVIKSGAVVEYAIIGEECVIEGNVHIGQDRNEWPVEDWGISVVGHRKTIQSGTVIAPKAIV